MDTSDQPKDAPASDGTKGGTDGEGKMDSDQPKNTPVSKSPKDGARGGEGGEDKMDTSTAEKEPAKKGEEPAKKGEGSGKKGEGSGKKGEGSGKKEGDKKVEPEPDFELLSNPTRVLTQQVSPEHAEMLNHLCYMSISQSAGFACQNIRPRTAVIIIYNSSLHVLTLTS